MTILKRSLLGSLVVAALFIPTAFASAATAVVQNLSPNATPMAKTNVTFKVAVSGFNTPYYQLTDSFANTTINSSNMNFGGNFSWVPTVTDIGTHTLTIKITDSDGNLATATQVITILPPPSITIQSVMPGSTVMPGAPFTFTVVFPGFVNPVFSVGDSFSGSTVTNSMLSSSGSFSWTPDATQNGEHAITIYASDSAGHSAQATTLVRVGSGPSLTTPSNLNLNISPGQTLNFTLTPAAYTPTGFSVRDTFAGQSTLTNNSVNTSGLVMWTPSGSDVGQHIATFTGQVGVYGQSASTTLTINVLGPNGVLIVPAAATPVATTTTPGTGISALQAQLAALQAQLGATSATAPATGTGYIFTAYLKQGSENDEVMELQKVLKKLGYLAVAPNGYFGPSTVAAVKKFQAARGLDQLGAVGPGTRLELNSLSAPASTSATVPVVTEARYVFEHFMGVGDDDPDVMELQKRLVTLGYLSAEPTGYYGAGTEAAVKKFQSKRGLPVTGYVAKNTRAELNK